MPAGTLLDNMDPDTLKVGDTFVCADFGGGTVDLISYTIEELGEKLMSVRLQKALAIYVEAFL